MSKYKVCVYAIAKNEEKFVRRWLDSMEEADEITVLDTGSTDSTVKLLLAHPKARVYKEEISPWRFDAARNRSLELVSGDADICVCTDLDEVFRPGWRNELENALDKGATQIRYRYTWNFLPDGSEGVVFFGDKIHTRRNFTWIHPVHEVIKYTGEGENCVITAKNIQLNHRADDTKSRSQYLPLLEMSVAEDPEDDRNMHYLAREYMFRGRYKEAIDTFKRHLNMKNATWSDERCASMRYIANCCFNLGQRGQGSRWLMRACAEAPHLREPWIELAKYFYSVENWHGVIFFTEEALKITERPDTYMTTPECWGALPYDLLSIAYHYSGDRENALKNIDKALEISPEDERLVNNRRYM